MKVVVIGGGPAGMLAAITAARNGNEVILLEKMRTVGRKLSITGKGRCNLTSNLNMEDFIKNVPGNGKFLYSVFSQYTNEDLIQYFNSLGVSTKVERGERVFPVSDNAMQVVNALKKELDKYKITLLVNTKVEKILVENDSVRAVKIENKEITCDKVILATGGKSYSMTGSDGYGYEIAKQLGHTIIEPKGSLIPMEIYEKLDLQGLALKNVAIQVLDNQKVVYEDFGEMLFTHFGISGPIILSASSHILRLKSLEEKLKSKAIKIQLDLKPALPQEKLSQRIQRDFEKYTKKQFKNSLGDLLPTKIIPEIIALSKINPEKQVDQINKKERDELVKALKKFTMTIKKFRPIDEAIVTAGGISVKEINSTTMESKKISGLYFAGEIIDVDAYTGGFNLQIAFSTGYVAGLLK